MFGKTEDSNKEPAIADDDGRTNQPPTEGNVKRPNALKARLYRTFRCKTYCTKENVLKTTKERIPIVEWLPHYHWKKDLLNDFFAGVTLAFINVPQGLAFSILANAPLVCGLYTACFSSFVYACLGTVQISSFGPAAVSAMLTGESVAVYMKNHNMTATPSGSQVDLNTRVTFIASLTFTIGLIYMLFFALQMNTLLSLFTKAFVGGFISGCAIHVLAKTFKLVLGLRIRNQYGIFGVYSNVKELILNTSETHLPTLCFCVVVITILLANTLLLKRLLAKVTKFILPLEGIILIASLLASHFLDLHSHGFDIVHHIPTGMPHFSPPNPSLLLQVIVDALAVAMINYAITFSMIMATTPGYNRAGQDTLAMSVMNLICSNIQCFVSGNSMMRTIVAVNAGIRTQLATIISSIILLFTLIFAGPLFEPLPVAVLGCIIVLAVGQLLIRNLIQFPKLFKISLEDGLIWVAVFTTTVVIDIRIGLITGFVLTLRQLLAKYNRQEEDKRKEDVKGKTRETSKSTVPLSPETK